MKIYELHKGQKFTIPGHEDQVFIFDHMDGMYCYSTDVRGNIINIAGYTDCIPLED